ncbi:MAG TPA: hypothetical protein PLG62_03830 [Pararhodobacter sp.]|uniref:NYN domain-containing protein n=1 Tax=Pararhodobacter sp. TaxID=2127056 RepID=UPI002B6F2D95|nr:hypothetical protein [Pararhodobacter sp.]HPD91568.1 hypothetical protein [Pararhodobacter sp.]
MPFDLTHADLADLALLAGPVLVAVMVVVLWRRARQRSARRWAVLDGSNILYWQDGTPRLDPVREVLRVMTAAGYDCCVVFDANAGHLLFGRYGRDSDFSARLGVARDRVMVVPRGEPADPFILTAARDANAVVVTNDRYRDWSAQFPEIHRKNLLVKGGFDGGSLWLGLPDPAATA